MNPISGKKEIDDQGPRTVTFRSVALACGLMPLLSWWVVMSEMVRYNDHSTGLSLFFHVTVPVFAIAVVNLWWARKRPESALEPGELLTLYVLLSIAGAICSHDFLQVLVPMIAYPDYAANPHNRWEELVLDHIPSWAILTDRRAETDLAIGNSTIYQWDRLLAWATPLVFWFCFVCLLLFSLLFMNSILRKQWTERERLTFPILQIPIQICSNLPNLLTNRGFWIAFGLAGGLDLWNGIHFLYPSFPAIPAIEALRFRDYLMEPPWNAIADTHLSVHLFAIGLIYFLPSDLAFSCWFFFILFQIERVTASTLGVHDLPGFPFAREQSAGGYLGLGLLTLWFSRRYLAQVWLTVWGRPGGLDESGEAMRYRTSVIGFLLTFSLLIATGVIMGAGLGAMTVFFIIFFLYALAIARIRAELGPPAHDLYMTGPDVLISNATGTRAMEDSTKGAFAMFYWMNRGYRSHFAAHSMEGFKAASVSGQTARSMVWAMGVAVVFGTISSFWALLHTLSIHGYSGRIAGDAFAGEAWFRLSAWVDLPFPARIGATLATVFGGVFAFVLGVLRRSFAWWAFHPVGYVTCASWSMEKLWFSFMVGWAARVAITRYGGRTAYLSAIPFFMGLVLGEFVVGTFWSLFGCIAGRPVYQFWG